jgi:hypothetical protein
VATNRAFYPFTPAAVVLVFAERPGYHALPSEANFFTVHLGREAEPVIAEFENKGILVSRPFPNELVGRR